MLGSALLFSCGLGSLALTLLVTRVLTDHHHVAVTTDDLALIADRLDAGVNLHASVFLLVAVDDAAASEVVGRQLHNHAVSGENTDVVLTHFARDVREHNVTVC